MTTFDPKLGVVVSGNEIVVVLPGSNYTVSIEIAVINEHRTSRTEDL
jgi:hypothetical protein